MTDNEILRIKNRIALLRDRGSNEPIIAKLTRKLRKANVNV